MIIKFVMKFLPACLPSGLTVAALDAFGRIPGVCLFIHLNMHSVDRSGFTLYEKQLKPSSCLPHNAGQYRQ